MTINARPTPAASPLPGISAWVAMVGDKWPLLLGLLALAIPTFARLGQQSWATESGAHGPVVLATGLWLLSQQWTDMKQRAAPAPTILLAAVALVALAVYAFGRAYDFISVETIGLYMVFIAIAYRLFGWRALWYNAFPFFYLLFMVPIPGYIIDKITGPLRTFVSYAATHLLTPLGYPIAREGVTLMVAQYQLLVEDACSGMNSLIGLTAIGLFYVHVLHRSSLRYSIFLIAIIIPVAIFVNIIRVVVLILLTYYFGDAVAQGFLHATTGIILFGLAVVIIFGIDQAARAFAAQIRKRAAT